MFTQKQLKFLIFSAVFVFAYIFIQFKIKTKTKKTYSEKFSETTPENDSVENFCKERQNLSGDQLRQLLIDFYKNTILDYGQYKGPLNTDDKPALIQLPESCFKNVYVSLDDSKKHLISLENFRENKIKDFKRKNSVKIDKKFLCENKRCVIQPYSEAELKKRPKPGEIIANFTKEIDQEAITTELEKIRNVGIRNGDDDLENLDFIKEYLESHKNSGFKIPNLVHFVWFSCHPYTISIYLSMLSALKHQNPEFIFIHGNCQPEGEYWDLFKSAAGEKLKFVKKSPAAEIFGQKITVIEHQSDVARFQILLQVGGIYLDTDVIVTSSLDELRRDHDIVLGEASLVSVASAGIIASKDSWFLKRWFQEYQTYKDESWGLNAVMVPLALWQLFPEEANVLQCVLNRPNWIEYNILQHGLFDWSKHFTVHLTTRFMDEFDRKRTLAQFAVLETSYGEIARFVLWGSAEKFDVRPWILHPDFNKI